MKRLFDFITSFIGIFVFSPILIIVYLLVKLSSVGPAFFVQKRIGKNGKIFQMIKFRSMTVIQNSNSTISVKGDIRVTKIGVFLRKFKLDELPELWNVLKGDMSLVGPRPELPWLLDKYEPWQRKRFSVPQGMTGWWQVLGRHSTTFEKRLKMDEYYISNWSLWMDVYVFLKTIFVVIDGDGA